MKKILYFLCLACLSIPPANGQGLQIKSGAELVANGNPFMVLCDGRFLNNGSFRADSSIVIMEGSIPTSQTIIGGDSINRFHELWVDKTSNDVQLTNSIEVDAWMDVLNGDLDLNGHNLYLVGDGSLWAETETAQIRGDSGEIIKTAVVNAPIFDNIGSMGFSIFTSADLGTVTLRRGHRSQMIDGQAGIQRYYKLSHTGNPNVGAVVVMEYLGNELNGMEEMHAQPWTYDSSWVQREVNFRDTSLNVVDLTVAGLSDSLFTLGRGRLQLSTKVMLEGNYAGDTLMHDQLRSKGLIPLSEPYTALGFNHINSGGEVIDTMVLTVTGDNAIVDWIFLEVRDPLDSLSVIQTVCGLLQKDGDIVDLDGVSPLVIPNLGIDDYYLAIRHRNHLPVRSSVKLPLSPTNSSYDFTTALSQAWDNPSIVSNDAMKDNTGVFLLHRANNNSDNFINIIDYILAKSNSTPNQSNIYLPYDINLDGNTNIVDFIITKSASSPNKSAHID